MKILPSILAAVAGVAGCVLALVPAPAGAQHDPAEVAKDRCDIQLTYQISLEAGGSVPDSGLDYRRARVTPVSSTRTNVEGRGIYRRDRYDRGRPYDYKCSFNPRTGVTKASYRWSGSTSWPQNDGWPGGPDHVPQGRVLWSGAILSLHSGKALDVAAGSNYDGAAVIQYTFKGTPNQLWDLVDAGRGRVVLVSQDSNKVLDVRANAGGMGTNGSPVQQFRYNGDDDQFWRVERIGGGAYRIVNEASGLCLDVEGGGRQDNARIVQFECQGGENQAWRLGGN